MSADSSAPPPGRLTAFGIAALGAIFGRSESEMDAPATTAPSSRAAAPASSDYHPFFQYYASLVHQQNMLADTVRTGAYHDAIVGNAVDFLDKVVIDVGTGSGVLAYFAVKAGARKVYAIEASGVAVTARKLLEANGLGDRITVLQGKVEDLDLPEMADIIVSEPMGFMLIHERMLESFIVARNRFLKPGGTMYPTCGDIYVAPFSDAAVYAEQIAKVAFWDNTSFFGLDLSSLRATAVRDHFAQPIVGYVDAATLLGPAAVAASVDFANDSPESLQTVVARFDIVITRTGLCHGLATWFDVTFPGSVNSVVLRTGPTSPGTHWYQCRSLLREPIAVNAGQRLVGTLHCKANTRFSYDMSLTMQLHGSELTTSNGHAIESFNEISLADQQYSYLTQNYT